MAKFMTAGPTWSLTLRRDMINVTSEHSTYNEYWRFTDVNGHEHRYDRSGGDAFPTLDLVVEASHWCDGTEGIALHDPHEHIDKSHWECAICRVTVVPTMDLPFTPKSIPGPVDASLTGIRSDGAKVTIWLTDNEAKALQAPTTQEGADAIAQRLIDEAPADRITSITYSR